MGELLVYSIENKNVHRAVHEMKPQRICVELVIIELLKLLQPE